MVNNVKIITYEEARLTHTFIDVRSPKEYEEDHIPEAVNIPIFTDEERAEIGTTYVQVDRYKAKQIAAKYVATKLPEFMDKITELRAQNSNLVCYCAKGGYRSSFFVSVFNAIDIFVCQLEGGYKEYRRVVRETMPKLNEEIEYVVLHGNTGTGKTDILHALTQIGRDVLDLEGAANHRGSLLGAIGLGQINSQKWFESQLFNQMVNCKSGVVFIEAESKKIGKVLIPECIHEKMMTGKHVLIQADIPVRVEVLRKEYGQRAGWMEEARAAMAGIEKHVCKVKFSHMIALLEVGNFDQIAEMLMVEYYDPMYQHKSDQFAYEAVVQNKGDVTVAAKELNKAFSAEFEEKPKEGQDGE